MIVSTANLKMILELCLAEQSYVNKKYKRVLWYIGYNIPIWHLCPVRVEEIKLLILTTWGLPISKLIEKAL